MRCEACNTMLTPYEDSIRGVNAGQRLGLCLRCLRGTGIDYVGEPLAQHDLDSDIGEVEGVPLPLDELEEEKDPR